MPEPSCVFPVRYVAEGMAVQTTSCDISALGIAVRSLSPPHVGARVSMALYLPDADVPEVAVGRVSRMRACSPADAGFWADFIVVDAHTRTRISNLLAGRNQPGQHRAFPRRAVQLSVRIRTARGLTTERAINLSRGGIFIRTEDPPPVSAAVEVEVQLPDGRPPVSSRGVVVHRQMPAPGKIPGAGLQFADASDAFRDRVDRYMDALIKA